MFERIVLESRPLGNSDLHFALYILVLIKLVQPRCLFENGK